MTREQDKLADAVKKWVTLRAKRKELRDRRYWLTCEKEYLGFDEQGRTQRGPCWKRESEYSGPNEPAWRYRNDPSEWCNACLEREEVHKQLREVNKKHGAAMRRVIALGKKL